MPTFIDESGDTGPIQEGGKPYFRLAAVWVPTHVDADLFREKVRSLRQELGLRQNYEFKYAETHHHPERRQRFFAAALSQEFRFAVASIEKTAIDWLFAGNLEQHWACVTELAARLRGTYCHAERERGAFLKEPVAVDDNRDKKFLDIVKGQFRGLRSPIRANVSLVGKVCFRDSRVDEMLQLVDMVCGAYGDDDQVWYHQIAERDLP